MNGLLRGILIFAGLVLVGIALYFAVLRRVPNVGPAPVVDFARLTPGSWEIIRTPGYFTQCDFDNDPSADLEALVLYRYDKTPDRSGGFIGGVIYTMEVNRVPQDPGLNSAYRPAVLIPYKLLPDVYSDKGQGYLGETAATVRLFPPATQGKPCKAMEITIYGFSTSSTRPTRLSIFRWDQAGRRYVGTHFSGDGGIVVPGGTATALVTDVSTYENFNDRSGLCKVRHYTRTGSADLPPAGIEFAERTQDFTIDYCYGAPVDPAYPEGVVMNVLRHPDATPPSGSSPTGAGYFMSGVNVPSQLGSFSDTTRSPIRVAVLRNQGVVSDYPHEGTSAPVPNATPDQNVWWIAAEPAFVHTTIMLGNGQQQEVTWRLVSVANNQVVADTHWRIEAVSVP